MKSNEHKTTEAPGQDAFFQNREQHVFHVPDSVRNVRLDAFLGDALRETGISREKVKQAIAAGFASINGAVCAKPGTRVACGDVAAIAVSLPQEAITAENSPITVLWQDEHLAVLNKPAGLTVHPSPGELSGTLANRLLHHFPQLAGQDPIRPGIVHRLDKDTSGLLLVALSNTAREAMTAAFAARIVCKEYLALVHGVPEKHQAAITAPIGRSPANKTKMAVVPVADGGREAHSDYSVLYADPDSRFSLVRVRIHTGRTHQIRVHMTHIGHPLIGDLVYKISNLPALPFMAERQMLHAWKLAFTHPKTGKGLSFIVPPPENFASVAAALAVPMQRIIVTGSPGSGKSALTRALQQSGLPAWSADETVKRLYEKGGDAWHVLLRRYGARFVPDDNAATDKAALFAAMRESNEFRREIEELIHPLVYHHLAVFWAENATQCAPAAVAEIPLALESEAYDPAKRAQLGLRGMRQEIIIGVYAPFALRRERMNATRGWSDETIAAMELWQWPETRKIRSADLIVDNSGTLEDLHNRTQAVCRTLQFLRDQTRRRMRTRFEALWNQ